MGIGRRQVLAGAVATGAILFAGNAMAVAPQAPRRSGDPEPLRHFPTLAEGFYRHGAHVYYVDERHAGWAPLALDASRLEPIDARLADIGDVVARLRRRHWVWTIEHAALLRLDRDRPLATRLLWAAVEHDLGAPDCAGAALRLYDLIAAILAHAPPDQLTAFIARLADRAVSNSTLSDRVRKWRSPEWRARVEQQVCAVSWRAAATDGSLFTTRLAPSSEAQFGSVF